MRFPRPRNAFKFSNEYDMILYARSAMLDRLENKDQQFVAQCEAVHPYMAAYVSIWKDTVAHVDVVI